MMKFPTYLFLLMTAGCAKQPVHAPVGGILSEKDLKVSRDRAKNLNNLERRQIEDWMQGQATKFYPMGLNYWVDVPNLQENSKKPDGTAVSYSYELYDFDRSKFYTQPKTVKDAVFGKFVELKAVEDALRYLPANTEATLLVPSVLAFGTYGDGKEISNDMPFIIKLKVF